MSEDIEVASIRSLEEDLVAKWNKKFETKSLDGVDFRAHWVKYIPLIYNPTPQMSQNETNEKVIFGPMEQFLCGSKDVSNVFEQLKMLNEVPSLCGRVFKPGEPTYQCRECALDHTCVLCVTCFTNSEHRKHRYKMSTSGGGGYCDCGDEEAWKFYPFCNNHRGKSAESEDQKPLDKLPLPLVERFIFILRTVTNYCHSMLTWEQTVNLPVELKFPWDNETASESVDTYCTILFNDETHTYEQVIDTLTKAINCSKKVAVDYATAIDREGRSIVKCGSFTECNQVRHYIERVTSRLTSKLKVLVMHKDIVAHQTFALKLLGWLQSIISSHKGFCYVFTEVIREEDLLEVIMLTDAHLWKTARNQWHQLFITGMLMEANCKKIFAKSFMNIYTLLMKGFIADDHDHTMSIVSLSVQIFTVPTLAHYLIEEENAMATLIRTFNSECERQLNPINRLHFQRSQSPNDFRRAQFIMYDLNYLMAVAPPQWSEQMRRNFLSGMQQMLTLLGYMQEMDPVLRQVGQHVEYEAEWESGINLQLKVAPVVSSLLKLCCSDYMVYVKSLRANIKRFMQSQSAIILSGVEVADHSASCIEYDVLSQPISIHLPLVRFMAGLLLHMDKYNLTYEGSQFVIEGVERPSPVLLMELPLRTLVMLAQFRAGMWRRNGYSLLNQLFFYHNVRLRDEMFDRDILMLQIAASMIESNEFLIHLIYKYGLINWVSGFLDVRKPEEDNIRHILSVAEEFLGLVLIILSERYVPLLGKVTEAERLKKEVIQLLCMEPMPHSQLFKLLPKNHNKEDIGLEAITNEVANFKMPQGPGVGKYELKPEYYKMFNPFYYHYTREEQSKAEEVQTKRRKQLGEEICCPPPVPPEFHPRFAIITNILQCDVMLHIMKLVLKRTPNLHSPAFTETQLEKVLHLIGLALHEEERATKADRENSFFCFTQKANKIDLLNLLDECLKCPRIDVCGETLKDLISWVINKYKQVESLHSQKEEQMQEEEATAAIASASRNAARDRKRKTEIAAARRTRIMAQMSAMQKNFIKEHADMFKEALLDEANMSVSEMDVYSEMCHEDPVCFYKDSRWRSPAPKMYTCILCREDQEATCAKRALVLSAFIQRSSILSKNRKHQLTNPATYDPLLLPADMYWSVHNSTCGHVMHSDCWQKFFQSVVHKEQRRPVRFGRHTSFDVEKKEFLCPLCERLSNCVIPLIPPLSTLIPSEVFTKQIDISVDDLLGTMKKICEGFTDKVEHALTNEDCVKHLPFHYKAKTVEEAVRDISEGSVEKFKALFSLFELKEKAEAGPQFSENLTDMMGLFSEAIYTVGLNTDIDLTDIRAASMSWTSCIYTIHAMEWLLRDKRKPLFGAHSSRNALCLDAIIRFCGTSLRIFDAEIIRTNHIRMLRYLLLGEIYLSSPQCCLDFDAFAVLAFLVLAMPILFEKSAESSILQPLGTTLDKHLLHTMLTFHFVQVLLTYPFQEEENMETDNQTSISESTKLHGENVTALLFYEEVRTAAGFEQCVPAPSGHTIVNCLKSGSLPFLRCSAIFFHVLTDTPPPPSLLDVRDNEFENICNYLGLPTTLDELLASTSLKHLALSWARHPRTLHLLMSTEQTETTSLVRHPVSINKLIPLPTDYSDLINSISQFRCPNSEADDSRTPTMCLVCGTILCSQSYCCQIDLKGSLVGACTHHAYFCGSGIGIFLRIRDCKILLLSDRNKGCYTAPPYVDDYGETDQGLYRGNPLHLCQERYDELHELWLSHNIPERVSHNMEQSTTLPNWQLL